MRYVKIKSLNAQRDSPVHFGFEAAVCGGIPIIHAMQRDFLGDEITQISGIINGCTNFILSNMALGGKSYGEAYASREPRSTSKSLLRLDSHACFSVAPRATRRSSFNPARLVLVCLCTLTPLFSRAKAFDHARSQMSR